jgi:hypothetical protein
VQKAYFMTEAILCYEILNVRGEEKGFDAKFVGERRGGRATHA